MTRPSPTAPRRPKSQSIQLAHLVPGRTLTSSRIENAPTGPGLPDSVRSNVIPFNREQSFRLPPDLTEWLPGDDVAHFTVAAVDRVALASFQIPNQTAGKPQYHLRLMLAP